MKLDGVRGFTLLEVVIALFILALGLGFLLTQFAIAGRRVYDAEQDWRICHEIVNAAEYLLFAEPGEKFTGKFADERFRVRRSWSEAELPDDYENPASGIRLATLTLQLSETGSDEVLETLTIDCPLEAEVHVADE